MMNQLASQTEIGKICSKQSPCSTPRLSRPAHTPSVALSHGQDPDQTKLLTSKPRHPPATPSIAGVALSAMGPQASARVVGVPRLQIPGSNRTSLPVSILQRDAQAGP